MSYRYPPGWAPPYQGAAPPMPSNISVNQQQWRMGSWQFNPAYNWQRYPAPQITWMAAPSWYPAQHRHQPVPANFNPYKKVVRPPSAEYLAMRVTDNGLDLHNMVPVENRYGDEEDPNIPKTPWIWNPATLSNDAPSESAKRAAAAAAAEAEAEAEANNRVQNRSSSESQFAQGTSTPRPRHATDPSSSSSSSITSASQVNAPTSSVYSDSSPLKPTFSSKIIRTPAHYVQSSNASSSTYVDSLAGRMEHLSTSEHSSLGRSNRQSSNPPSSITGAQLSAEPASVLSPLVIPMTPRALPRRPITRGATEPKIGRRSGLDIILELPRRHESSSNLQETPRMYASQTAPGRPMPNRSESYPRSASPYATQDAASQDGYPYSRPNIEFGDSRRPSNVQQHTPPEIDSYPAPQSASSRQQTFYPTTPSQPNHSSSYTPTRHSSSHQSSPTQAATSHTTSRHSPPKPPRSTPPSYPHDYPITPVSLHRNATPVAPYTYQEERPKPVKPYVIYVPVSLPSAQGCRLGYWNRRGDHCTEEGYLVFAPPELANPPELSTYPERDYQSHVGIRVAFDPKRPELPESLPRHGQPPEKPYKDFVIYVS